MSNDADAGRRVLSPRDLARALGVSESSIKRWVDDGALSAVRTSGGHRRIPLAEAVRFIRKSGTPVLHPELLTGARLPDAVAALVPANAEHVGEALWQALHGDDPGAGRGLVLSLYMSGWPLAAICDGPIRGVLARIGELWQHGPAGIFTEHRATDTCLRALSELRTLLPPAPGGASAPLALGGAPAGDPYLLPSLMASLVLAEQGFVERNLGPDTPADVLLQAATHYRPRVVWLAIAVERRAPRELLRDLTALATAVAGWGGVVALGGRGVPALGPLPDQVHTFASMAELAAFARGLRGAG